MAEQNNDMNQGSRFIMKGQYIKDLSFENPHAPHTLVRPEMQPTINVGVALRAQRLNDEHFELTMNITVHAKGQENTLFVVELDYSGIVQLVNIPEDKIEQVLFIDCATILFPFARRIMSDVTRDGGFQPLMMEPIDFTALYEHNKKQQEQQQPEKAAS